jgi:hypothetical protein
MPRRLFRVVAFLPPALLGVVVLLWLRSYLPDDFYCRPVKGRLVLFFLNGTYSRWLQPAAPDHQGGEIVVEQLANGADVHVRLLGIEVAASQRDLFPGFAILAIPFVWLAVPLAGVSVWSVTTYRRRRAWAAPGRCSRCGYDLRGSAGPCPECGTPRDAMQPTGPKREAPKAKPE